MTATLTRQPFTVIGRYKPTKYRGSIIGKALTAITKEAGLVPLKNEDIQRNAKPIWSNYNLHAEVRRTAVAGSEGTSFHHDGDTSTSQMDFGMVLWSNWGPTEIRYNGKTYTPKPFEVVYFDNMAVTHRRPPGVVGKRWSFRQRVNKK